MNRLPLRLALRCLMALYLAAIQLLCLLPKRREAAPDNPLQVLMTGTFYTDQWLATHLRPLASSERVNRVTMIASRPVPAMEKVVAVYPPRWARRLFGEVLSRTLVFLWYGLAFRYDIIGGFHFLLNGLFAVLLAKIKRRRSLYICGGGPREVEGGGWATENRLFGRLDRPDGLLEKQLLSALKHVDVTICMGHGAAQYFRQHGITGQIEVLPGGFDDREFFPATPEDSIAFDLILIGRLSAVKRVDLFIDALAQTPFTAVIVGDGPDREALEQHARGLGVAHRVTFAGWQEDVAEWLRRARVFVLTSESEGLSQALVQALMCGLPAVVANVGDLPDVVQNGGNGFLVDEANAGAFAERFSALLNDKARYARFRRAALESTVGYRIGNVADTWNGILAPPAQPGFDKSSLTTK